MAAPANPSPKGVGRFEQSFVVHMIRDFFLLLVAVAAIELAIRYLLLRHDFASSEPTRVDRAAQQLAQDLKSIMLNSGGPVAAQTVYPILERAYGELGLSIEIAPSDVTVASMKLTRDLDVKGLPARWPAGEHQRASVSLGAEQFCIGCHVKAKVGDILGTVQVRSYLERKESLWWQEVRLSAGALSVKALVHTIVLFLLLKVRMEPLLALRSTVGGLAKGVMNLSPRAAVKSEDEFGELALDLNHFLDRIASLVQDLDRILSEVVTVGARLGALNRHLERQLDTLRQSSLRSIGQGAQSGYERRLLAARESGAFSALKGTLAELVLRGAPDGARSTQLLDQLDRLGRTFDTLAAALDDEAPPAELTEAHASEYQAFAQSLREMALLEATMQKVAETGQQVLHRLTQGRPGDRG